MPPKDLLNQIYNLDFGNLDDEISQRQKREVADMEFNQKRKSLQEAQALSDAFSNNQINDYESAQQSLLNTAGQFGDYETVLKVLAAQQAERRRQVEEERNTLSNIGKFLEVAPDFASSYWEQTGMKDKYGDLGNIRPKGKYVNPGKYGTVEVMPDGSIRQVVAPQGNAGGSGRKFNPNVLFNAKGDSQDYYSPEEMIRAKKSGFVFDKPQKPSSNEDLLNQILGDSNSSLDSSSGTYEGKMKGKKVLIDKNTNKVIKVLE